MATMPSLATLALATQAATRAAAPAPQSLAPVPAGTMQVRKGDFVGMGLAMRKAFLKVRGPNLTRPGPVFPNTTNQDAIAITRYWTDATRQFRKGPTKTGQPKQWQNYANPASRAAEAAGAPNALHADNANLWREVASIASYLSAMRGPSPSKWDYAWESIKDSASELPDTLAGAGNVAGRIIAAPVAGISSALGINAKTLLTGAALVGVSVFVTSRILK